MLYVSVVPKAYNIINFEANANNRKKSQKENGNKNISGEEVLSHFAVVKPIRW